MAVDGGMSKNVRSERGLGEGGVDKHACSVVYELLWGYFCSKVIGVDGRILAWRQPALN